MTIIESLIKDFVNLSSQVATLRSEYDGLASSLNDTSKGLRELIDNLRAELNIRRDGETAIALGLSDRINGLNRKLDSFSADNVAMYETAKVQLFEGKKSTAVLCNSVTDRINSVEAKLDKHAGEERGLQVILDSANERANLILDAKDQWMDRALKAEAGVTPVARARCMAIIKNFRAPGFTGKSRKQLLKLIQEAE